MFFGDLEIAFLFGVIVKPRNVYAVLRNHHSNSDKNGKDSLKSKAYITYWYFAFLQHNTVPFKTNLSPTSNECLKLLEYGSENTAYKLFLYTKVCVFGTKITRKLSHFVTHSITIKTAGKFKHTDYSLS